MGESLVAFSVASSPPVPAEAAAPAHAGGIDAAQAKALIDKATAPGDIQTLFYNAPKPKPVDLSFWKALGEWLSQAGEGIAKLLKPLGPAMPFVVWGAVGIIVVLILAAIVRLLMNTRFERLFFRSNLKADAPWRPTRAAVAALLEEIDALAAKGEYDEAVHLLLMRSVADINAFRPDLVRIHFSARDILSHPLLPEAARPAFRRIVGWVEKSFFAGIAAGKEGFDACRAAYMEFVSAEGLA